MLNISFPSESWLPQNVSAARPGWSTVDDSLLNCCGALGSRMKLSRLGARRTFCAFKSSMPLKAQMDLVNVCYKLGLGPFYLTETNAVAT